MPKAWKTKNRGKLTTMPKPRIYPAREDRIEMEAVVGAYRSDERAMEWYYYLDEKLAVPFEARVGTDLPGSPLSVGGKVEVLGMAHEGSCETDMLVWVGSPRKARRTSVPSGAADR